MSLDKRRMQLNALTESQLSYCPLILIFLSRTFNNKINRLQKKSIKYSDFKANFDKILEKDGSFSIQHENIQTLAIEILKFLNRLFHQ